MQPKLVVITGPTASGKTALGVVLAQRLGGEVVSADSMQIYRGMDIGTAKPTPEEMQGVPHHMIDIADPAENYSVSRYAAQAAACVDDILARGKLPIVVGGTGLYIDSLIAGRTFADGTADTALRRWFDEEQIAAMRQAVEDHRASAGAPPRNLYGRIVAEADRLIEPMTIIRRTVQYGLAHYPELDREGHYARCMEHLQHKYGDGGYLRLWLAESENARRLEELRALLRREEPVREAFERIFDEETAR